jgi:hypothetical protein
MQLIPFDEFMGGDTEWLFPEHPKKLLELASRIARQLGIPQSRLWLTGWGDYSVLADEELERAYDVFGKLLTVVHFGKDREHPFEERSLGPNRYVMIDRGNVWCDEDAGRVLMLATGG